MKKFCLIFALFFSTLFLFADDDDKLKLAVMEFEDKSGKLSQETLDAATEYLRSVFTTSNNYIVISKSRQKEQVSKIRKEYNTNMSYKSCTDRNCQIQLGQALSADVIVQTTITFFAGVYTIASDLTDLEKEATVIGAKADYNGSEQSMKKALESIVEQITATYKRNAEEYEKAAKEKADAAAQKAEQEKKKAEEEKNRNFKNELARAGKTKRIALAATSLVSGAIIGSLGGVSFYGMSKAEKDRKKYYEEYNLTNDTDEAIKLRKKVNDAKKQKKTYGILGGVGIGLGAALITTGIVLFSIEFKGEKEVKKKYDISFGTQPTDGTFYLTLNW